MIKVTLFRDMQAEAWRSMDRYANNLIREYKSAGRSFVIFSTEPPLPSSRFKLLWRDQVYPFLAYFRQGSVNHVLDHSYAHLLDFLDPHRTIITCHDLIPLDYEFDDQARTRFKGTVSRLRKAAFLVADSEVTKRDLVRQLDVPSEKIKVIYLGVEPIFRRLGPGQIDQVNRKYGLPSGPMILSHGNTLPYKNIEGILRVFRLVLQRNTKAFLVHSGSPLTTSQRALVSQLGLIDHLREIISPLDEDLVGLYNRAQVFLCPSFKEGFGLPVLESMACGTPVVVSAGTSLVEITGDCGIAVDPRSDESLALAVDEILEGSRIVAGEPLVERARLFSWKDTANKIWEIYDSVYLGRCQ